MNKIKIILLFIIANIFINHRTDAMTDDAHYQYALEHQLGSSKLNLADMDTELRAVDGSYDEREEAAKLRRKGEQKRKHEAAKLLDISPPRAARTASPVSEPDSDDDGETSDRKKQEFIERAHLLSASLRVERARSSEQAAEPTPSRPSTHHDEDAHGHHHEDHITIIKQDNCWQSYPYQLSFDPEHPENIHISIMEEPSGSCCLLDLLACCFSCCFDQGPSDNAIFVHLCETYKQELSDRAVVSLTLSEYAIHHRFFPTAQVTAAINQFPALKQVHFNRIFCLNEKHIMQLTKKSPALTHISITGHNSISTPSSIRAIGKFFGKTLLSINLDGFSSNNVDIYDDRSHFDNDDVYCMMSWARSINHLNLRNNDKLTREGILRLLDDFKHITSIAVPTCTRLRTSDNLKIFIDEHTYNGRVPTGLKTLDVSNLYFLQEDDIAYIAMQEINLHTLVLPARFRDSVDSIQEKIRTKRSIQAGRRYQHDNVNLTFN